MGLLDEAIREHLELKRRRGADPTEVERLEREALGPVRRIQREAQPEQPPDLGGVGDPEPGATEVDEWAREEDYSPAPLGEASGEPEGEYALEANDRYAMEETELSETPPYPGEASEGEGVTPPVGSFPEDAGHGGHSDLSAHQDQGVETAEYDVEASHGEGDDVLEETPEFLQDTPDHDRLWFEQRPPKDFDFDG